jgi:hypothetical protein
MLCNGLAADLDEEDEGAGAAVERGVGGEEARVANGKLVVHHHVKGDA